MNVSEKKQIATSIARQIADLNAEISQLENGTQPVAPDDAIGRLSRMEAIAIRGVNQTTLNECRLHLQKLLQCQQQLDHPDYGYCARCDKEIPLARLLLVPEADTCVACAED